MRGSTLDRNAPAVYRNREPADRLARELVGTVQRLRFHDPATGAVIVELRDGSVVSGTVDDGTLECYTAYRFLGRWTDHHKFGPQFKFDTYTRDTPADRPGVIKYLTDYCPGIGTVTAQRLWDAYGSGVVQLLRTDPAAVSSDGYLKPDVAEEAAAALRENEALERTRIDLFTLFAGRGFPGERLIKAAVELWGARAPARIRRNPYALLVNELPGCGFKRTDRLYLDLGFPRDALKRQTLAAWNHLREDGEGHTWYRGETVVRAVKDLVTGDGVDPVKALKLGIRAGWLAKRVDEAGVKWIAEREKARKEQLLADCIRRLNK